MADSDTSAQDASALRAGYERLRAAVLAGSVGGWRLGHGVLSARGMSAWMSAVDALAPALASTMGADAGAASPASEGCERPAVALPHADQVVAVLTQMVLPLAA